MTKQLLRSIAVVALAVSFAVAGNTKRKPVYEPIPNESQPVDLNVPIKHIPAPDWSSMSSAVGTFTTLTGFYDYQSNGGAVQHIRVNPANGNIHTTWMSSSDSTAAGLNPARRVRYAFSSDGGSSWNNFSNLTVPSGRSGFPTIDLLKGANAGLPVIASHPDGSPTIAKLFVDSPEGAGAFSELGSPPILGTGLEPIWPYVASASDGSLIVAASQNNTATTGVGYHIRLQNDFTTWDPTWTTWDGDIQSGGRNPVQANGTGRVGILWNTSNGTAVLGNRWKESTNNGASWTSPVNVFDQRIVGPDTLFAYVHADFVYDGDNPLRIFSEFKVDQGFVGDADIVFWSQATGFVVAVPFDSTKYSVDPVNQRFHRDSHGWASIGLSGSTIVVAYQAFQPDTDRLAYHYSDLWYVASSNGGTSWGAPQRITNTPTVDERYPSVSKWNAPGEFNMVWTQKSGASGLYAFPGGADTVRTYQMFLRVNPIVFTTSVDGDPGKAANSFKLSQNYPNPFNPATKIDYTVGQSGPVTIKVYNTLGQEVATLLNEHVTAGSYQVSFDGSHLSSGVYIYKMTAGAYQESRKMVLMK